MLPDVIRATYRDGYSIEIEFDDGARGTVDFSGYLARGGVFERFKDIEFFRSFRVDPELGVLSWGGEVDVAPETLYAEATGRGLPDWMREDEERTANNRLQADTR
jgi:hypothetical protein